MNRSQKRILKLTSGIVGLSFALITASVGTVAWFMANSRTHVDGIDIETVSPDMNLDYTVFKYDFVDRVGKGYKNNSRQFFLPDYEYFLKDENDDYFSNAHTNAILMATANLNSFNTTTSELNFDIICNDGTSYATEGKVNPYTSNIAQFKCFVSSYLEHGETESVNIYGIIEDDEDDSIYRDASEIFKQIETPTTFVSVNGTNFNKSNNELTITPILPEGLVIDKVTFFVEVTYNERLVDHYISTHATEAQAHNYNFFNIGGDVEKIRISTAANTHGTSNSGKYIKLTSNYNVIDANYLAVHRDTQTSASAVVLDGALDNDNLTKGGNTISVDVVENTIAGSKEVNAASLRYDIENSSSSNYKELRSSNYRHNDSLSGYAYSTAYRQSIGTKNLTTAGINRSNHGYTNNINIRPDGYSDVTTIIDGTNDTHLLYNTTSNVKGFKYYNNSTSRGNVIKDIEMFRYAENADSVGVLSSLELQCTPKTEYIDSKPTFVRPTKVVAHYTDGGVFDVTNLVTYSISNGTVIGDDNITEFIRNNGQTNQTIVGSYEEYNGNVKTISYGITIAHRNISSISINTPPTKTSYYEGETIDYSGLKVNVYYNDGTPEVLSYGSSSISYLTYAQGATLSYGGTSTVQVQVGTFITSFNITISQRSISITSGTTDVKVKKGSTITVTCSTNPSGQNVTWVLSDTTKASLSNQTNTSCDVTGISTTDKVTLTAQITSFPSRKTTVDIEVYDSYRYEKVTTALSDWSGTYLLVYEASSTTGYAFDVDKGDTSGNYSSKTITSSDTAYIESQERVSECEVQIAKDGTTGNYTIMHGSNYIGSTSTTSNTLYIGTNKHSVSISFANGFATITDVNNSGRWFQWNNTTSGSGGQRFRFYNSNNDCHLPALYKIPNNKAEVSLSSASSKVVEGVQASITATIASGKDGYGLGNITWSGISNYNWNSSTGVLTWTPSNAGQYTITASLPNGNSASVNITVVKFDSITISGYKTELSKGSAFNFGGTVTAHYSDNTTEDVTSQATFTGYNMSTASTQTVTVHVTIGGQEKTKTYSLTVKEEAAQTTITKNSFSNTSDSLDSNISYSCGKGDGTADPFITNNTIRLYQPASNKTNGGTITITSANGKKIKSIVIGSHQATTVAYKVGSGSYGTNTSISKDSTMTVSNLDCTSITFTCRGASSSNRLEVNYLSVTYA